MRCPDRPTAGMDGPPPQEKEKKIKSLLIKGHISELGFGFSTTKAKAQGNGSGCAGTKVTPLGHRGDSNDTVGTPLGQWDCCPRGQQ